MGDADCTYDFRELAPFVDAMRSGTEFVMGSRFNGSIEPGSMPALHRYLGTPVTTWILNRLYGSQFTDIHCGMRGITRDALCRMDLLPQSWEYASEMVLKSVHMELRTTEVPVSFLKDRDGRLATTSARAGSRPCRPPGSTCAPCSSTAPSSSCSSPASCFSSLGLLLTLPLSFGDDHDRSGHVQALLDADRPDAVRARACRASTSAASLMFSSITRMQHDDGGDAFSATQAQSLRAGCCSRSGSRSPRPCSCTTSRHDFSLPDASSVIDHLGIVGLLFMIIGFSTFCFTLVLHATEVRYGEGDHGGH